MVLFIYYTKNDPKRQKTVIFSHFSKKQDFQIQFLINFVLENCILISNRPMKCAIFYEFIKKITESASLKNGKKWNCVYPEALCTICWCPPFHTKQEELKSGNTPRQLIWRTVWAGFRYIIGRPYFPTPDPELQHPATRLKIPASTLWKPSWSSVREISTWRQSGRITNIYEEKQNEISTNNFTYVNAKLMQIQNGKKNIIVHVNGYNLMYHKIILLSMKRVKQRK